MKILTIIFLIVLFANTVFAQESVFIETKKKDWRMTKREKINTERKLFVKRYVDSLNSYKVTENCVLPDFFLKQILIRNMEVSLCTDCMEEFH